MSTSPRSVLVAGARHQALLVDDVAAQPGDAALVYGFVPARTGPATDDAWTSLGRAPLLERPLRLSHVTRRLPLPNVPLLVPFGQKPRKGFRELTGPEPRMSRLWGRFSVDVGVAVERDARFFAARLFEKGGDRYRVFIMEDGDRYAIRAMCVFTVREEEGYVVELLHDRTLDGMRSASHVLGLALRAMSDAGASVARACSLSHSGSFPMFVRHAFLPVATTLDFRVRAEDPSLAELVTQRGHWYVSYLDLDSI